MPLTMNRDVFITCAVTGSGGTQDRSPHVPRSPKQIADSAIAAARAGAAIILGATMGFVGVAWSNPFAWIGAALILVPAYIRAHKRLATMPMAPMTITPTTPIAVIGPVDGSMNVEAVVTQPVRLPQPSSRMQRALRRRPTRRRVRKD